MGLVLLPSRYVRVASSHLLGAASQSVVFYWCLECDQTGAGPDEWPISLSVV
jgi:hypothetical protein